MSLRHMPGPSLEGVLSQDGTFYGMHPTTVTDFDGDRRPSPISVLRDQQGPSISTLTSRYRDCPIDPGNL